MGDGRRGWGVDGLGGCVDIGLDKMWDKCQKRLNYFAFNTIFLCFVTTTFLKFESYISIFKGFVTFFMKKTSGQSMYVCLCNLSFIKLTLLLSHGSVSSDNNFFASFFLHFLNVHYLTR